jgi:hypothetical protein
LLDLAEVLRVGGRIDEAADCAESALREYEEKGNLVGADAIRVSADASFVT